MTETRGVVTELYEAARTIVGDSTSRQKWSAVEAAGAAMEDPPGDGEANTELLAALDLVASWPPVLRALVQLIEALPEDARRILPDVLRGLMNEGPAAVMAAAVGKPVSVEARLALWASGLSLEDLDALRNALLAVDDEDADHAGELAMELLPLREAMAREDLDLAAEPPADERMARKYLAGTCPEEVLPGQKRRGFGGLVWTVEQPAPLDEQYHWFCSREGLLQRALVTGAKLRSMPLAEDFPIPEDM